MSIDIARAWKDSEYRASLTETERASLPANPVGEIDLADADLENVVGGAVAKTLAGGTCEILTLGCCPKEPSTPTA